MVGNRQFAENRILEEDSITNEHQSNKGQEPSKNTSSSSTTSVTESNFRGQKNVVSSHEVEQINEQLGRGQNLNPNDDGDEELSLSNILLKAIKLLPEDHVSDIKNFHADRKNDLHEAVDDKGVGDHNDQDVDANADDDNQSMKNRTDSNCSRDLFVGVGSNNDVTYDNDSHQGAGVKVTTITNIANVDEDTSDHSKDRKLTDRRRISDILKKYLLYDDDEDEESE